jgi:hypothetical protein
MTPGEIWFVKNSDSTDPLVTRAEITYLKGNVIGLSYNSHAPDYYDLRLLDFVARDYEEEERRAQETFMDTLSKHEHHGEEEGTVTSPCGDGVVYPDPKQTYIPAIDFGPDSKICNINEPYSYQVTATHTKPSWLERFKLCLHELRVSLLRT